MATTKVENLSNPVGELIQVFADIDGLASYTAGGQVVNAQDVGLKQILFAVAGASDNAGHDIAVLHATKGTLVGATPAGGSVKLVWTVIGTGAEVAGAVNLSARFVRVGFWGR